MRLIEKIAIAFAIFSVNWVSRERKKTRLQTTIVCKEYVWNRMISLLDYAVQPFPAM